MKCIIAGSRSITDFSLLEKAIKDSGFEITEVISGTARGVDLLGERWAAEQKIKLTRFPANWKKYGNVAGNIRNEHMADYAGPDGCCIILHDGRSVGSAHMRKEAKKKGLKLYYIIV